MQKSNFKNKAFCKIYLCASLLICFHVTIFAGIPDSYPYAFRLMETNEHKLKQLSIVKEHLESQLKLAGLEQDDENLRNSILETPLEYLTENLLSETKADCCKFSDVDDLSFQYRKSESGDGSSPSNKFFLEILENQCIVTSKENSDAKSEYKDGPK